MRKMMMGLVALGAIGCGGESGEALVKSLLDAQDDGVRFQCGCFWEAAEYASEAECLTDNLYTNAEMDCLAAAVGPAAELNVRHVKCIRNATHDFAACVERFGCGVTEARVPSAKRCVAPARSVCPSRLLPGGITVAVIQLTSTPAALAAIECP